VTSDKYHDASKTSSNLSHVTRHTSLPQKWSQSPVLPRTQRAYETHLSAGSTARMERVNGIAPSSRPWHGRILLLNHTREMVLAFGATNSMVGPPASLSPDQNHERPIPVQTKLVRMAGVGFPSPTSQMPQAKSFAIANCSAPATFPS
jgi:hypothetical protein